MTEGDAVEILRAGFIATVVVAAPPLIAALTTGVLVSIVQALTQIQEMTLAAIPKIVVTLLVVMITLPWGFGALKTYMEEVIQLIVGM